MNRSPLLLHTRMDKVQVAAFEKLITINKIRQVRYQVSSSQEIDSDLVGTFLKLSLQSKNNLVNLKYWKEAMVLPDTLVNTELVISDIMKLMVQKDRTYLIAVSLVWEKEVLKLYNEALSFDKMHWTNADLVGDIGHQREGIQLASLKLKYLTLSE